MCTTQGMTRLLASIYCELVLTQEYYYDVCLYTRVLLAYGKYLYVHLTLVRSSCTRLNIVSLF